MISHSLFPLHISLWGNFSFILKTVIAIHIQGKYELSGGAKKNGDLKLLFLKIRCWANQWKWTPRVILKCWLSRWCCSPHRLLHQHNTMECFMSNRNVFLSFRGSETQDQSAGGHRVWWRTVSWVRNGHLHIVLSHSRRGKKVRKGYFLST